MKPNLLDNLFSKLKLIRPWYFLVLAILFGIICIFALRANNEHMLHLRNAVYSADKNDTDVAGALQQLQAYVTTHMNTNLSDGSGSVYPPIQLKYTYQRLLGNESAAEAEANSQLYTAAQSYCQGQIPNGFSGRFRVPCIEQYIESHDSSLPTIPDALYKFDFISPSWSPDLAGWSMALTIISFGLFVVSFTSDRLLSRIDQGKTV